MGESADRFDNLDRSGRATAAAVRQPRNIVFAVVFAAVALSWLILLSMASGDALLRPPGASAPGDWLVRTLPGLPVDGLIGRFLALCLYPPRLAPASLAAFAALSLMWFLMALAMMLPSAAPLIRTYCEIADTARGKGEPVVHPLVLVAGYLATWLLAALAFAGITQAVWAGSGGALTPATGLLGAGALAAAGLYQFSSLKEACLKRCRNPFAVLFSRWTSRPAGIFRLGVEQGIWCLGCCWALMLVMFAVGLMNVFWMALIGLFTLIEKTAAGPLPTRAAGTILLVWAAALLLIST